LGVGVAVVALAGLSAFAQSTFTQVGSYTRPATDLWTPGADGRLWVVSGSEILRQDAVHGGTYSVVGSLASGFGSLSALAASPDGSSLVFMDGTDLRVLSTATLSTSTPSATSSIAIPGQRTSNGSIAFAGGSLYLSSTIPALPPTGPQPNPSFVNLHRVDLTSNTVTTVASIEAFGPAAHGGVGAFGDRLFWTPMYLGADSTRLLRYSVADLGGAAAPLGVGEVSRILNIAVSQLVVDGNGTALWTGSGLPPIANASSDPASSGDLIGSSAFRLAYNAFTGEVLSRPDFPPQITRWSIPTPGAAAALALGGLVMVRRRR
jgi:hypothetical protein